MNIGSRLLNSQRFNLYFFSLSVILSYASLSLYLSIYIKVTVQVSDKCFRQIWFPFLYQDNDDDLYSGPKLFAGNYKANPFQRMDNLQMMERIKCITCIISL